MSLQALEVFETVARTRSLRHAARELDISISSVFHHLARLEGELGTTLLDRGRRPLRLTAQGQNFLLRIEEGLRQIRLARSETEIGAVSATRVLRLGLIDELEGRIGPDLALALARTMPRASLSVRSLTSLDALEQLAAREIDFAVAADAGAVPSGLTVQPLLRDPFVMAVAKDDDTPPIAHLQGDGLPMLRYAARHLLGRQIDAQLRRNGLAPASRYEFDETASILALVAAGQGWAVTTPVAYERVWRYRDAVRLQPLPIPAFSRHVALFGRGDGPRDVGSRIADLLRDLLVEACVAPATERFPWLRDHLRPEGVNP
ncbi:LysR family transcriptional regulator [Jannaschia sp. S6380]|uniref:LysR family transcriptional regulator n=1 Tax=Jannaschia sp. S6380 TaxID=2926408 RepID=UPI001FF1EC15|nr:LysR family transcriptional regulator [Jannaschia sp. S6380]MCK0169039.1 LysR family transcriptional regulator [Jannaschia sp. S6380]